MTVPILFLYIVGIIFFIFGIEGEGENNEGTSKNIVYLGMAWFVNFMGYYLSYSDVDYTLMAYLPLVLLILTTLVLIYTAWGLIQTSSWDSDANKDDDD